MSVDWIGRVFGVMSIPKDRLMRIVDQADLNGDGDISLSELVRYLKGYTRNQKAAEKQAGIR